MFTKNRVSDECVCVWGGGEVTLWYSNVSERVKNGIWDKPVMHTRGTRHNTLQKAPRVLLLVLRVLRYVTVIVFVFEFLIFYSLSLQRSNVKGSSKEFKL
jgi:hypothetical protein